MNYDILEKKCERVLWLLFVAGILMFALIFSAAEFLSQPKFWTGNCPDFGSYAEAWIAYHVADNRGLDGDNDGIPCDNLKKR